MQQGRTRSLFPTRATWVCWALLHGGYTQWCLITAEHSDRAHSLLCRWLKKVNPRLLRQFCFWQEALVLSEQQAPDIHTASGLKLYVHWITKWLRLEGTTGDHGHWWASWTGPDPVLTPGNIASCRPPTRPCAADHNSKPNYTVPNRVGTFCICLTLIIFPASES